MIVQHSTDRKKNIQLNKQHYSYLKNTVQPSKHDYKTKQSKQTVNTEIKHKNTVKDEHWEITQSRRKKSTLGNN